MAETDYGRGTTRSILRKANGIFSIAAWQDAFFVPNARGSKKAHVV